MFVHMIKYMLCAEFAFTEGGRREIPPFLPSESWVWVEHPLVVVMQELLATLNVEFECDVFVESIHPKKKTNLPCGYDGVQGLQVLCVVYLLWP